jgi:hypothetical protein
MAAMKRFHHLIKLASTTPMPKGSGKLPVAEGKSVPAYLALKHAGGSLSETKHRPKNGKRSDRQSHDGKPRIYLYCM